MIAWSNTDVAPPSVGEFARTAQLGVRGRWLRVAAVHDEEYCEHNVAEYAGAFVERLRRHAIADVFTFSQRHSDPTPRFDYPLRWDNAAIVSIAPYQQWLESLGQVTRRNVRLAARRGLAVNEVGFTDALVAGIASIYNEAPVRQGRRFWHYGKDLAEVKRENGTYLDRSHFIGAHHGDELVGFIKMVRVGDTASIMQILSKTCHQDKRPTNALIAKAVEICDARGIRFLKYCKYVYHQNPEDPLTVFKHRHGFREVRFPRYFVPLTARGRVAIRLGLHLSPSELLPRRVVHALLRFRAGYHSLLHRENLSHAGVAQSQSG